MAEFRQGLVPRRNETPSEPTGLVPRLPFAMYARLGAAPPPFLWCDSPMTAKLAMSVMEDAGPRGGRALVLIAI